MTPGRTYLDWNATTPLRLEARAAMVDALDRLGNPSSIHAEGRAARRAVEEARDAVASLIGAEPRRITFTSGGTEANALALDRGWLGGTERPRFLLSAIEHPSVLAAGGLHDARLLPVTADGLVDLAALSQALADCARDRVRPHVSVMLANNETGVIQPVAAIAERVHEARGLLHVDAVQGPGKMTVAMAALGADLVSLSAHKIGGPAGVGALVRASDAVHWSGAPRGGGQERGLRAGTENAIGIVGFGAAAAAATGGASIPLMASLRDRFEAGLKALTPQVVVFGAESPRLANTCLFARAGQKAETLVIGFDLGGIAVSSGAACSSGKVAGSHVLAAMGIAPELARGAVRVSLGWSSTEADIDRALEAWKRLSGSLSQSCEGCAA